MFHEIVHKTENLFNISKQSLENFAKNPDFQLSIGRRFLLIDQVLSSIDQTRIEHQSRHSETPRLFSYHFRSIKPKI